MKKWFYIGISVIVVISLASCNNSNSSPIDDNFVGLWKYYGDKNGLPNDGSMNDVIGTLKKVDGTKGTYSFDYLGFNLLFSKKDYNTLEGVDNKNVLEYNETNQHLMFHINSTRLNEFTKLK